jgi:hypothetical protein
MPVLLKGYKKTVRRGNLRLEFEPELSREYLPE